MTYGEERRCAKIEDIYNAFKSAISEHTDKTLGFEVKTLNTGTKNTELNNSTQFFYFEPLMKAENIPILVQIINIPQNVNHQRVLQSHLCI